MTIEVLASGSDGNCTAFFDGKVTILLECGLPYQKTLEKLNWKLPDAILITHEHGDHARSAKTFLKKGVEVYMTPGTADALEIPFGVHNLHYLTPYEVTEIFGHKFMVLPTIHDAADPVCFIIDDKILFVTDTRTLRPITGNFDKIFVEANYEKELLDNSDISFAHKYRIAKNHLAIFQVKEFLRSLNKMPDEIHLLHISKRHGDAKDFARQVKAATGVEKVFTH